MKQLLLQYIVELARFAHGSFSNVRSSKILA